LVFTCGTRTRTRTHQHTASTHAQSYETYGAFERLATALHDRVCQLGLINTHTTRVLQCAHAHTPPPPRGDHFEPELQTKNSVKMQRFELVKHLPSFELLPDVVIVRGGVVLLAVRAIQYTHDHSRTARTHKQLTPLCAPPSPARRAAGRA
jgi:hypothetical protein